jgi:tetratricopeptide (TPR) repeat protein
MPGGKHRSGGGSKAKCIVALMMGNIGTVSAAGRRSGRFLSAVAALALATSAAPAVAQQQDDIDEGAPAARISQVPGAQGPIRPTAELNAALSRLARDPRNVSALIDAGQAALRMGDTQAALGFYTRADQVSPNNGRIKIQIGSALVQANEPADAVKFFDAAESANADLTSFALDRGLAYDLLGDNRQAQGWYQVALSRGVNEEATLRYAISLAISHDLKTAETLLSPLIQKQDRAAWRARTFALAINGDETQAVSISRAMMPPQLADAISPYLRYMPRLTRSQQAAAANLGRFPRAADIGHDDSKNMAYAAAHPEIGHGLVPAGAPLGALASSDDSKTSRAKRRVPGRDESSDRARAAAAIDGDLPPPSGSSDNRRGKDRGKQASPSLALATTAQTSTRPAPVPQPAYTPPPQPSIPVPTVRSVLDGPPIRGNAPPRSNPALALRPAPIATARPTMTQPATSPTPATTPPVRSAAGTGSTATAPAQIARPTITPTPSTSLPPSQSAAAATVVAPRSALQASSGPVNATPVPGSAAAPTIAAVALPPSTAATASAVATTPAPRPATNTTFDLARLDASRVPTGGSTPSATPTSAPRSAPTSAPTPAPAPAALVPSASPPPAAGTPPANDFGSAFGGFTPPPAERGTDVAAVDLSQIKPVRRRPGKATEVTAVAEEPVPTTLKGKAALKARLKARGDRPDGPLASRSGDEDEDAVTVTRGAKLGPKARKAALEAEAEAKKAGTKGKNGKRAAPANPSRIWVQLLTAPNRDAFPREWARITRQAPSIFRGKRGWVTPWGRNYRLLMGPYASDDDAQDALNDLTKAKVRAFVWTSPAGQAIDHLGEGE